MQTKEQRDRATLGGSTPPTVQPGSPAQMDLGPLMGVPSTPKANDALLSDDPTEVVVVNADGKTIDWQSRKGFGELQQKLAVPARAGYMRYWFNEEPGRISDARNAGWVPVVENGEPMWRVVDKNTGLKGYLHEIPIAWYKADLAEGQKRADAVDAAILKGNAPNPAGQAAGVGPQKGFYGGIKMGRK